MKSRVNELIESWLQNEISPAELAELESALLNDPEARRHFYQLTMLDSTLRDWAMGADRLGGWQPHAAPSLRRPRRRLAWGAWGALAAGAIAAAIWVIASFTSIDPAPRKHAISDAAKGEQTALGAAILTQTVDATWDNSRATKRIGDTLSPGTLHLQSGYAQVEFLSGAALLVEGPAEFEIVSPWEAICRYGKIRVRVPPAARGFRVLTPEMKVVDLGTEFGLEVDRASGSAKVHVFSGEVEAYPQSNPLRRLKEGQGIEQRGSNVMKLGSIESEKFVGLERMRDLGQNRALARFQRWQEFSAAQATDPRLLIYYPMAEGDLGGRLIRNLAQNGDTDRDGGLVGAIWGAGRWPQKHALKFKGPADRARINIGGTYNALTFACWVKVDGLDRMYNSLLLTDGYDAGEPHWQIFEDGRVMFSLSYPVPGEKGPNRNFIYYSPAVFDKANTARWHHLAVTYENQSGVVIQYLDGLEISREVDPRHVPGRPIVYGECELGNWGLPFGTGRFPIRNLNGSLDEFAIYRDVLSGDEIRRMFEAGRPE